MGTRTVSVDLQLKAAGFVAGAKEAEKATNSLNDELDDVAKHGRDFDAAIADADKLTVAMGETSHEVDQTGTQMKETGVDARFLAGELSKARDRALELAAAFSLTGDKADLAAYKKETRYVSDLERLLKAVTPDAAADVPSASSVVQASATLGQKLGKQLGLSAGESFGEAFSGVLSEPVVWVAAIPILVEVGAMAGAALLTGIGLAGIGAGIAAQIQDPRVQAAGSQLARDVASGFRQDTAAFAQPIADVLTAARSEWDGLSIDVRRTFDYLALKVHPIGDGLIGFADHLVPALEDAAVASGPLLDTFAKWLPQAGEEFAGLLDTMASNTGTLNDALKLTLGIVSGIVDVLNVATSVGSKLFQVAETVTGSLDFLEHLGGGGGNKAASSFDHTADSVGALAAAAAKAGPSLEDLNRQLSQTVVTTDQVAEKMATKLLDSMLGLDHATLGLAESQSRLSDSIQQNGRHLDIHTAKGQANREAVLAVVGANVQAYTAMINSGASADEAAQAYDQNTAALEDQLHKAKFTKTQIDDLIGSYRKVPTNVNTNIAMNGLTDAINDLDDLIRQLNGLPPRKVIIVEERHHVTGQSTAQRWGGVHYAADGLVGLSQAGVYSSGPLYGFAEPETGGEAFVPRFGDPARSAGILQTAAGWYGMAVGRPAMQMGGGGPQTLQLAATFVLPGGEVVHQQLITYALNTGRQPAQLFPAVSR